MGGKLWVTWLVCLLIGLGASGCDEAASVRNACAVICRCESESPTLQAGCVEECTELVSGLNVPQACVDCVALAECGELEQDACEPECNVATPLQTEAREEMCDDQDADLTD